MIMTILLRLVNAGSRRIVLCLLGLTMMMLAAGAAAQTFKKNGTAGFTFLEIPVTARTAALGEASIALSDGEASAMFDNPAGMGFTNSAHSLAVSYSPWFADIRHYASGYAMKTSIGVIGAGVVMLDYGSMPRTVVGEGQKVYDVIGSFSANSLVAGISYSAMLTDKFSFGGTVKYVQEKIDVYKASNVVLDGGVLYYTGLGTLRIAAVLQNFGVNAKFINDEFKMPAVFKLGAAMEVFGDPGSENRLTLLAGALHPNDSDEKVVAGLEYAWMNVLVVRGGYKFFYDEETYSFGVGVRPPVDLQVAFDFAYSSYGRLGKVSRLTLQLGFK